MRKTKKEKFLADIRRKMAEIEREKQFLTLKNTPLVNPVKKYKESYNYTPPPATQEKLEINFSSISRDLKRTLLVSFVIIFCLVIIKFYLKS